MPHRTPLAAGVKSALSEWSRSRTASTSRLTLRSMATSGTVGAEAAAPTLSKKAYPFAPSAVTRQTTPGVQPNANMSAKQLPNRGVMAALQLQLRAERDPNSRFSSLFSRTAKDAIPPGSVLLVETYTNASKTSFSTFSGILIAIRRRGLSSSFVLRNIVSKLGVEIRFNMYSPLLKDVKVVQRALAGKDDKTGKLRRARRAKLYYLRQDDRKLAGIGKSISALRAREEAEKAAKMGRKRTVVKDRR